jgi:hypothetical protein
VWRFTIRDAMMLAIIIGLVIAWGIDCRRLGIGQDRLDTIVGGLASREVIFEFDDDGVWMSQFPPDCSAKSPDGLTGRNNSSGSPDSWLFTTRLAESSSTWSVDHYLTLTHCLGSRSAIAISRYRTQCSLFGSIDLEARWPRLLDQSLPRLPTQFRRERCIEWVADD